MEFISIPVVVGIVTLGIYGLFDLIIRRKERLTMIDKMGDKITPDMLSTYLPKFPASMNTNGKYPFGTLKIAGLLMGIGMGLLGGFLICYYTIGLNAIFNSDVRQLRDIIVGASTLLGGGLGLLLAFIVEIRLSKK